jgi:sec-independent protein translocase protein TatC
MALVPFPKKGASPLPDDDPDWEDEESESEQGKMSFLDHLDELRRRIVWSLVALVVGFVICVAFLESYEFRAFGRDITTPGIFEFIMGPMREALGPDTRLQFIEPTEPLMLRLKMAALAGLVLASPFIMWQVWMFIAPGLYANEKKMALPFVALSSIGFIGGTAFAHFVVFTTVFGFFAGFTNDITEYVPQASLAFAFYVKLLLVFGLVFQMPTVILVLSRLGLVTAGFLWRNIKYAVLIMFIIGAVLSPGTDPIGQALLAGPMIGLYILSIGLAWIVGKKRTKTGEST